MMKNKYSIFIVIFLMLISVSNLFAQEQDSLLLIGGFSTNGLYGYINKNGDIVIEPKYSSAYDFHEGVAVVRTCNKSWAFIDQTGRVLFECDSCFPDGLFSEGLICVELDNPERYVYMNKFGEIKIDNDFYWGLEFNNGLAAVEFRRYGKTGFINKQGNLVIDTIFTDATRFSSEFSGVCRADRKSWGILDLTGKFVETPNLIVRSKCKNGLIPVSDTNYHLWGFINTKGEVVIPLQYRGAKEFSQGLAPVFAENKEWGYIDTTGKIVIEPFFSDADSFAEGLAAVCLRDPIISGLKEAFINMKGEIIIEGEFWNPQPFKDGICQYWTGYDFSGDIEYIRKDGKRIWPKSHKH